MERDEVVDERPLPQHVDLADIESLETPAPSGVNPAELDLQGDAIPEEFRGKKLSEVFQQIGNYRTAIQTADDARRQALATAEALTQRAPAPAVPAPAPVEDVEPTEEQLKTMFESDPFKYHQTVARQTERRLSRQLNASVTPMAQATASAAEQAARTQYPEEFTLLDKEIKEFVEQAFPDKQVLATPGAWDRVVKYVRGEHVDKIIAHRTAKANETAVAQRRQAEADAAMPNLNGERVPRAPKGRLTPATMDEVQKEIARNLMPGTKPEIAYTEYCKHYI